MHCPRDLLAWHSDQLLAMTVHDAKLYSLKKKKHCVKFICNFLPLMQFVIADHHGTSQLPSCIISNSGV